MIGQQQLLLLWAWTLLVAALYPGALCKAPTSKSGGSSRQGLKMAGAAAAGALGEAAIEYGLGSLGKPRHGNGGCGNAAGPGHGPMSNILLTLGSMVPFIFWGLDKGNLVIESTS
uniref:Uncharacterized protein n=1 Tax=Oncorhynchus tshawytscha TaxID=74940 RepID=A0A8C8ILC7_ONCTS